MTIIAAIHRGSFIAIAAERRCHGVAPDGRVVHLLDHQKIYIHPDLPVAAACAGVSHFDDGARPIDHVITALNDLGGRTFRAEDVLSRIETRVGPLAEQRLPRMHARDPEKAKVEVYLAFGAPSLQFLRLRFTLRREPERHSFACIRSTTKLHARFTAPLPDVVVFGLHCRELQDQVRHLRRLVASGIWLERFARRGRSIEAGGAIDTAVVDASGARWVA